MAITWFIRYEIVETVDGTFRIAATASKRA
jgi:hypothetical protein